MTYSKDIRAKPTNKQSIMSAFKPIYIVLTLFGLLPYSLKFPKGPEGAVTIRKSIYFNSLCSVSMILILYSFFVLHTQQVFAATESNAMTEVLTTKFNYMTEMLTLLVFSTCSYYCAFKYRFTYVKILNVIVSSSNKYRGASLRKIQLQLKGVTVCLVILFLSQCTVNFTRQDTLWKKILVTSSFILPQMIQFTVLSFYYVLVLMVVGILRNIDDQVKGVIKARKFNAAEFVKVEIRTVGLRQIEVVFVTILEAKREINKVFEASMLVTSVQCFHSIVSESHILYHGLATVDRTLTTHDVCNCSIWIGYQLLKIYIMSRSGNMLKKQVAKIGRSLHDIPAGREDTKLYIEIQHFSTLMLFHNAELTVYNYFPLDATLTFNIITAAVMYLIMLVQFDRSP